MALYAYSVHSIIEDEASYNQLKDALEFKKTVIPGILEAHGEKWATDLYTQLPKFVQKKIIHKDPFWRKLPPPPEKPSWES